MFTVNDDLSIYLTRGDTLFFNVRANDHGYPYTFKPGDIVRISVTAKKDVTDVYIQKDFPVYEASKTVFVYLEGRETKIGDKISKYRDYWYEIVLNPDTVPQTIIGNNEDGAKIFRLFPEADDVEEEEILPEEVPVVDAELDLVSDRPVSNRAVAAAVARLTAAIEQLKGNMPDIEEPDGSVFNAMGQVEGLAMLTIDAYGVAVKNGFNGTVKAWLASLNGITPHIGDNGNWFLGDVDTGHPSKGNVADEDVKTAVEKYFDDNPPSSGDVNLTGYAKEQWVAKNYQQKGNYLTEVPAGFATEEFVTGKIAEAQMSGGEVDLSAYAKKSELPTKVSQLTNDKGYLTEHQDISGKLDADKLPDAISTALAQAKASGEFNGNSGYSPVRGTDYWTAADIAEIKSYVDNAILGGAW